jgi:epoxyqueuosine reductase
MRPTAPTVTSPSTRNGTCVPIAGGRWGDRVLMVHACCAPCLAGSARILTDLDAKVHVLWYNPNIMPYREYLARLHEVQRYAALRPVPVTYDRTYDLDTMLRMMLSATVPLDGPTSAEPAGKASRSVMVPTAGPDAVSFPPPLRDLVLDGRPGGDESDPSNPPGRCKACIGLRLHATALMAREMGADGFTTTMLLSKYKPNDWIRRAGNHLGQALGVPFVYTDLRKGWKTSIAISRELELYRQPYCGCVFSEWERYGPD